MTIRHSPGFAPQQADWSLYSRDGQRKYVNASERARFLASAALEDHAVRSLCMTLAYTGCRISEALNLTTGSIQPEEKVIAIRTLKKRGRLSVREVPVPDMLIQALTIDGAFLPSDRLLWPLGRTYAWQQVKRVMEQAGIRGIQASPRGLRHGFGVSAIQAGVPINLVQKWLGHANIATTAIYTNALGPEEREIAARMW